MKNMIKRLEELKAQSIVSIDAETNGLWGQPFSVAAVVFESGEGVDTFVARCPINEEVNPWVAENVLPQMTEIEETHTDYRSMLDAFFTFLREHTQSKVLCHMGHIVEARLLRDAYHLGVIGEWDAPYEWYDVCLLFGDSVDTYCCENKIDVPRSHGGTHNPLYDCMSAYAAFRHMITE